MYKKAAMNVEMISEEDIMTEKDLKDALATIHPSQAQLHFKDRERID